MSHFPRITFYALLGLTAAGYVLGRAWGYDDGCPIAEWKCDVGWVGLALFIVGALSSAAMSVLLAIQWFLRIRGGGSDRLGDEAARPVRSLMVPAAFTALLVFVLVWVGLDLSA